MRRRLYRHSAAWVLWAVSTSEDKYDKQFIQKKGQHSLVESVALKAPAELLYDSYVCYTISQRCTAPRIAIPSRTSTVDAAVQLSSAVLGSVD